MTNGLGLIPFSGILKPIANKAGVHNIPNGPIVGISYASKLPDFGYA